MMRKLLLGFAGTILAVTAVPAFAHPEPDDGAERGPTIPDLALDGVAKLISQGKLPASWMSATVVRTFSRSRGGDTQLIVEFRNDAIRDPAKRTLFVVMNRSGQFISANHRLI
jgi:hypothetical protein